MVIARALPDSPVPPKLLIVYVFSDPLDRSGSKLRCASDGDSEGSPRQLWDPESVTNKQQTLTQNNDVDRTIVG
eukprot:15544422-Heterocapsa_arctica.AAC.1